MCSLVRYFTESPVISHMFRILSQGISFLESFRSWSFYLSKLSSSDFDVHLSYSFLHLVFDDVNMNKLAACQYQSQRRAFEVPNSLRKYRRWSLKSLFSLDHCSVCVSVTSEKETRCLIRVLNFSNHNPSVTLPNNQHTRQKQLVHGRVTFPVLWCLSIFTPRNNPYP